MFLLWVRGFEELTVKPIKRYSVRSSPIGVSTL